MIHLALNISAYLGAFAREVNGQKNKNRFINTSILYIFMGCKWFKPTSPWCLVVCVNALSAEYTADINLLYRQPVRSEAT